MVVRLTRAFPWATVAAYLIVASKLLFVVGLLAALDNRVTRLSVAFASIVRSAQSMVLLPRNTSTA